MKSVSLTTLKHEVLSVLCARTAQALARQAACPLVAQPIQHFNWGKQNEDKCYFSKYSVLTVSSLQPPCTSQVLKKKNRSKKWKLSTLVKHDSWSSFSTQNSVCSSSLWRLIVWFWESALEAIQGHNLTKSHTERKTKSMFQMTRTADTVWEREKSLSLLYFHKHQYQMILRSPWSMNSCLTISFN